MASTVSDINVSLAGSTSGAFMGATRTSAVSTDSGSAVSAFQGQLDKAMQQSSGMKSTSVVSPVVEDTGTSLSEDVSAQTKASSIASVQKPNLSTGKQSREMSTVDKSDLVVRTTKQKVSDIVNTVVEDAGASLSEEISAQNEASSIASGLKPNLSTGKQSREMSTVDKSDLVVRTTKQKVSDIVNTVVEDAGASLSKEVNAQTKDSSIASGLKPNLSTGEQSREMSTVDKSRFVVRTAKQKVSDIEDALENGGGAEFLTELKNLLLSLSNRDLDNLSLDGSGLDALGDLLVQAGFDQASVEELMSDLNLTLEEGNGLISVSDFMDDLFELPLAEDEDITQADALMPTSDLPYIKSLLSMMGVDEEEITSIMAEASEGTRGFDFDAFIEQLKQLLDTTGGSGQSYQTDGGGDAYGIFLKQLDLDSFIEKSDEPLTLATLIDAFSQKLNQTLDQKLDLAEDNPADQTEQSLSQTFTTDSVDALATQSGRHGLLNQLLSGLNIQEDSEKTVDSAITPGASSNAMVKEIEDRFQVQFMNQVRRGDVRTNQTGEADSDHAFKIAKSFSDTAGTTKDSASQSSIKAPQTEAPALEKIASTNPQSGDTASKGSETQTLVLGMEKSATTANAGTSGTQRTQQALSTLPDFVTRQVGKSIVRSINAGDDTIRMQLKPPELGRVYMSIDHDGSSMKLSVITEHQSAKDILTANINEIKAMLSFSGISLESFEVNMSSDFQQSMADARTQDQSARKQKAKRGAGDDTQDAATDNLTGQFTSINDSGSLHFVA
ncbi:flagellar hook-length control protein FliK [Desulfobacter vibrioformis]|uniref:flagellar hook-length control protein FliK n=1 Tax=Desulfobacter vibrioformis TaxID=34031 RepID=UPI001FE1B530|nr:flagellar hook-length control protein FliK [Desulfobacter vibrioformis]